MDNTKEILSIIFSWPAATILIVFLFRKTISDLVERLIKSKEAKAKVGPLEIELGKIAEEGQHAVDRMKEINSIMAKSRVLELEITDGMFGAMFSDDQRKRMNEHISTLSQLTNKVEQGGADNGDKRRV